ncbi:MAG TPA: AI-2E family transporter [Anaerolineales bacterium]|nr:AI-2E family transporter [Anaerolineales bacterium]
MTEKVETSPHWSSTTKLLAGLVILGIIAFLLNRFASLLPPLLLIVIIVYLLHPVASFLSRTLRISWRAAVNVLYLFILLFLMGLITWGGVGLVQQVQSLIRSVQDIVSNLPVYIDSLTGRVFEFGPFTLDMRTLDLNALSRELLSIVQPLLGQTGNLVGAIASGAVEVFGWTFFILIVSYFVMVESKGLQGGLFTIDVPGYSEDLRRLGNELSRIWNAFLRGQIIVFTIAVIIYSILLPILGVRYALGIALMAGLAKFLPYIGPAITWIVMALVTFFQPNKPFGLSPLTYTLAVVIITSVVDQIIDSFITPRIMARTLKVHPAAVLVVALIAANLLGLLGVIIAAPFLATIMLLGRYTMRKMFDMDPWAGFQAPPPPPSIADIIVHLRQSWQSVFRRRSKAIGSQIQKENPNEQQQK